MRSDASPAQTQTQPHTQPQHTATHLREFSTSRSASHACEDENDIASNGIEKEKGKEKEREMLQFPVMRILPQGSGPRDSILALALIHLDEKVNIRTTILLIIAR